MHLQLCAVLQSVKGCTSGNNVELHPPPAGVAESIIQFAQKRRVDAVVLGARGMGAIKRCVVSLGYRV